MMVQRLLRDGIDVIGFRCYDIALGCILVAELSLVLTSAALFLLAVWMASDAVTRSTETASDSLEILRHISCLVGEKDGSSTVAGAVLGVAVVLATSRQQYL